MANITIVAADVTVTGASFSQATAGEDLTAGDVIYLTGSTAYLAQSDTSAHAAAVGVCVCDAATGQPVLYAPSGVLTTGAAVAPGQIYVVSGDAGQIAPATDLEPSEYVTILGMGKNATTIQLLVSASGVLKVGY